MTWKGFHAGLKGQRGLGVGVAGDPPEGPSMSCLIVVKQGTFYQTTNTWYLIQGYRISPAIACFTFLQMSGTVLNNQTMPSLAHLEISNWHPWWSRIEKCIQSEKDPFFDSKCTRLVSFLHYRSSVNIGLGVKWWALQSCFIDMKSKWQRKLISLVYWWKLNEKGAYLHWVMQG